VSVTAHGDGTVDEQRGRAPTRALPLLCVNTNVRLDVAMPVVGRCKFGDTIHKRVGQFATVSQEFRRWCPFRPFRPFRLSRPSAHSVHRSPLSIRDARPAFYGGDGMPRPSNRTQSCSTMNTFPVSGVVFAESAFLCVCASIYVREL